MKVIIYFTTIIKISKIQDLKIILKLREIFNNFILIYRMYFRYILCL